MWTKVPLTSMCHANHMLGHPLEFGNHARRHDFFTRGKLNVISVPFLLTQVAIYWGRYSILPALSLDGIIALEMLDCPFTALMFNAFTKGVLDQMNPWPQKKSVIVMDNTSIHKSEEL